MIWARFKQSSQPFDASRAVGAAYERIRPCCILLLTNEGTLPGPGEVIVVLATEIGGLNPHSEWQLDASCTLPYGLLPRGISWFFGGHGT